MDAERATGGQHSTVFKRTHVSEQPMRRQMSSAGVSASAASLISTIFVCCLITDECSVAGSVRGSQLWKDMIVKKVFDLN